MHHIANITVRTNNGLLARWKKSAAFRFGFVTEVGGLHSRIEHYGVVIGIRKNGVNARVLRKIRTFEKRRVCQREMGHPTGRDASSCFVPVDENDESWRRLEGSQLPAVTGGKGVAASDTSISVGLLRSEPLLPNALKFLQRHRSVLSIR